MDDNGRSWVKREAPDARGLTEDEANRVMDDSGRSWTKRVAPDVRGLTEDEAHRVMDADSQRWGRGFTKEEADRVMDDSGRTWSRRTPNMVRDALQILGKSVMIRTSFQKLTHCPLSTCAPIVSYRLSRESVLRTVTLPQKITTGTSAPSTPTAPPIPQRKRERTKSRRLTSASGSTRDRRGVRQDPTTGKHRTGMCLPYERLKVLKTIGSWKLMARGGRSVLTDGEYATVVFVSFACSYARCS